jgi:uncharacterized protein YbaR (Trm112 family)
VKVPDEKLDREAESRVDQHSEPGAAAPDWLVQMLVCPVDRAPLNHQNDLLTCTQCGRTYPIEDGIPMMIPDGGKGEQAF